MKLDHTKITLPHTPDNIPLPLAPQIIARVIGPYFVLLNIKRTKC